MPTDVTFLIWQNKAWSEIAKVMASVELEHEFNPEAHPFAEHLNTKLKRLTPEHTFPEYLEKVMSMLHHEAEQLERAKLAVRALRYSKS